MLVALLVGTVHLLLLILHTKGHAGLGAAELQTGAELLMAQHVRSACLTELVVLRIPGFMRRMTAVVPTLVIAMFEELGGLRRTQSYLLLGQKALGFNRETSVRKQDHIDVTAAFDLITSLAFDSVEQANVPVDELLESALRVPVEVQTTDAAKVVLMLLYLVMDLVQVLPP